jgi:hypothetical protein
VCVRGKEGKGGEIGREEGGEELYSITANALRRTRSLFFLSKLRFTLSRSGDILLSAVPVRHSSLTFVDS